ncbi:hypothetical protein [Paenibacillus sp. 1P03SA]|uniref:hypothetical protein n=1 Tax=Paenibacillus sp. 1P03SA TaxID=3132294 RepID=UPI0039A07932
MDLSSPQGRTLYAYKADCAAELAAVRQPRPYGTGQQSAQIPQTRRLNACRPCSVRDPYAGPDEFPRAYTADFRAVPAAGLPAEPCGVPHAVAALRAEPYGVPHPETARYALTAR